MDVPQQPVVAIFNLATAFRRDRSPSRAHIQLAPAESARQASSWSEHGSSLQPPAVGGNYLSRSFEFSTPTAAERPTLRRSPRSSFDENAPGSSSRLQVAERPTLRRSPRSSFDENAPAPSSRHQVADRPTLRRSPRASFDENAPGSSSRHQVADRPTLRRSPRASFDENAPEPSSRLQVAERPTSRRSPRASFDENASLPSSRLQVADIIPHTCGRRRSFTMSHRSPTHVRDDSFQSISVNEHQHSQLFSLCPSPRRSPIPPSTNATGNETSRSSGQRDARYGRQPSIQKPLDDSFDQATSSGRDNELVRRRSSNAEWELSGERSPRSPPLSSPRSDERSAALSDDMRRRLSIGLGTRTWKSDESAQPRIRKTTSVKQTTARQVPQTSSPQKQQPQKPRQATTRPLTRAMTVESGVDIPSSSSDKKSRALISNPVLFDPLVGRTLTLKSLLPKEKKALRLTFSVMNNNMFVKLMEQILHRLEAACPEIRSLFFTTAFINSFSKTPEQQENHCQIKTVHDHAKIMAQMFEDIISNLDTYDVMVPYLRQYGQKHALMCSSGFKVEVIEKFGELAVDYIGKQEAIKYNHIAVGAWRLLIACITDEMRFGFERECKKYGRQNSLSDPADIEAFRASK